MGVDVGFDGGFVLGGLVSVCCLQSLGCAIVGFGSLEEFQVLAPSWQWLLRCHCKSGNRGSQWRELRLIWVLGVPSDVIEDESHRGEGRNGRSGASRSFVFCRTLAPRRVRGRDFAQSAASDSLKDLGAELRPSTWKPALRRLACARDPSLGNEVTLKRDCFWSAGLRRREIRDATGRQPARTRFSSVADRLIYSSHLSR